MSHSFSYHGYIPDVRVKLRYDTQNDHAARVAKAVINADLDLIEAQGGTHANVSAHGHDIVDGSQMYKGTAHGSIATTRDTKAEAEYAEEQKAKAFDAWYSNSLAAGHVVPAAGALLLNIPELATKAGEIKRISRGSVGSTSPNETDGAGEQKASPVEQLKAAGQKQIDSLKGSSS
jgi:hypothetical protein